MEILYDVNDCKREVLINILNSLKWTNLISLSDFYLILQYVNNRKGKFNFIEDLLYSMDKDNVTIALQMIENGEEKI